MRISPLLLAAALSTALCGAVHADTVTFTPLHTTDATLTKISGNGQYAVSSIFQAAAVRWNAATGTEEVIPGMNDALGINNSGTVSGSIPENGGSSEGGRDLGAFSPVGGTPTLLTDTLQTNSTGYDISDDGTVVGLSFDDNFAGLAVAFAWTAAGGMTALPVNRPENYSRANAISADGQVIVGWNDQEFGGRTAVIWQNRVPFDVADADGNTVGEASGVSNNGRFVVGADYGDSDGNYGSWRWDAKNGVQMIPGMGFAFGVSNDGKTIVGANGFFDFPPRAAMIWREGIGAMPLTVYLAEQGFTMPDGWDADLAGGFSAISGDGTLMGGWSFGPVGTQSYLVHVTREVIDSIFADGFEQPTQP